MDNEVFLPSKLIAPKEKGLFPVLKTVTTFGQLRTLINSLIEDDVCTVEIREDGIIDPDNYDYYEDICEVPHYYDLCKVIKSYYKFQKSFDTESEINRAHGNLNTILDLDRLDSCEGLPSYISERIDFGE